MTQSSALVFDESEICQLLVTHFTAETFRMPSGLHCLQHGLVSAFYEHAPFKVTGAKYFGDTHLDDPPNDELATLVAARSKEDMEVMFTILATIKLIEDTVRERSEALCADKTAAVEQFTVAVDNLGLGLEAIFTASTGHTLQVHDSWHVWSQGDSRTRS